MTEGYTVFSFKVNIELLRELIKNRYQRWKFETEFGTATSTI